jgi:uncharacterized protein (DUF1697 family)
MSLYAALLRGINVGGNHVIKMTDLQVCFEDLGFLNVRTFIQSGNVIFSADGSEKTKLTAQIEDALSRTFSYNSSVVMRSYEELSDIVLHAPQGFGSEPDTYRYDVIFLKEPLTPSEVMHKVSIKEGVDWAYAGSSVLYFTRLISKAAQSHLTRINSSPLYQSMTVRNWNTTIKLLKLMDAIYQK